MKTPSQDSEDGSMSSSQDGEISTWRAKRSTSRTSIASTSRQQEIGAKVQNLKQEFTELLMEIRKRKSIQDGGIYIGLKPQVGKKNLAFFRVLTNPFSGRRGRVRAAQTT